jgi:hypothetical protein
MRIAIFVLLAASSYAAEPAEGRWEGSIQIPGTPLTAVIDLAQTGGQWIGSATLPGFTKGAPLADIVVQSPAVSFVVKGALGEPKFTGQVGTEGALAGTFVQAGNTAAFHLRKVGPPQVDLPRQSTAVAADLEGEWQGDLVLNGNKLKATLKLTNAGGRATAQFLVVGKRETNIPVDLVRQEGDLLMVVSSLYRITFEGRYRKDAAELTGTFAQGPVETPLSLKKPQ